MSPAAPRAQGRRGADIAFGQTRSLAPDAVFEPAAAMSRESKPYAASTSRL
jgi:hypothetical protein